MTIVKNIVTIPLSRKVRTIKSKGLAKSTSEESGIITNGHTEVFAKIANTGTSKATIDFSVTVNSVNAPDFNTWFKNVSMILGKNLPVVLAAMKVKIENEGQDFADLSPEKYMAVLSLFIFDYAYSGGRNIETIFNKSNVPFTSIQCTETSCNLIINSILNLKSTQRTFSGTLVADENMPVSKAFIPVTFFQFTCGKVVSFAGYRGPLILPGNGNFFTVSGILS